MTLAGYVLTCVLVCLTFGTGRFDFDSVCVGEGGVLAWYVNFDFGMVRFDFNRVRFDLCLGMFNLWHGSF